MYLQVGEGRVDESPLLVLDRLPSFIDHTHSYVDETALGAPISSLEDVAGWLGRVPFDIAAAGICRLAGRVHDVPADHDAQQELVDAVFATPILHATMSEALRAGRGRIAIAPQTVTRLARLAVEHAGANEAYHRPMHGLLMERALVGAASLDGRDQSEPSERDVLAMLVQIGSINARVPLLETLGRWHHIYTELATSEWARRHEQYCDVVTWCAEAWGLSPSDQAAVAISAALSSGVFGAPDITQDYGLLTADWAEATARQLDLHPEHVADVVSAPREWFASELAVWREQHGLTHEQAARSLHSAPFDARPFVRLGNGHMALWSPRSFVNWATDGLRDRAHAAAQARRQGPRFSRFHAALFERYCLNLVREAYSGHRLPGAGRVSGEQVYDTDYGQRRSPDIAVDFGHDLVLLEVASGQLAPDAKALGTADRIESDLLRLLINKATQLSARIDDLLAELYEIPGVQTSEIERIWPVVVTGPGLFMTEPLWSATLQRIAPALSQPRVQPLVVLDAYDLETLVGLCEGGSSMHQVLARKANSTYQALDFSRFVSDDPRLHPMRARSVLARGDRLFDDFAARVGLNVAELRTLREDARTRGELL